MSETIRKYQDYVMTGFTKLQPIVIERARGAIVTDVSGRDYIDCFAGISVVNAGHANPEVLAAAKAQIDKLTHCCSYVYHVPVVADLAEKLAEIAPGPRLRKTFFANSGAEAIEGAMKLARLFTGRHEYLVAPRLVPRPHLGNALDHGQRQPQAPRRALRPGHRVRRAALRLPLALPGRRRGHGGLRDPLGRGGDRLQHHQRHRGDDRGAGDGRGRHHRAARLLLPRAQARARRPRDPVDRGRSAVGLRPYRQDVRDRALRRRARHPRDGQGHRRRLPAGRLHGPRRDRRGLPAGRSSLDLRRQSRLVRRRPRERPVHAAREPGRAGARQGRTRPRACCTP